MIRELEPIWKQFEETSSALRESLAAVPEDQLNTGQKEGARTPSELIQHIARGNHVYSAMMLGAEPARDPDQPNLNRLALVSLLEASEQRVRYAFESLTEEDAHVQRDESWRPLGPLVTGSLDAIWFALQIVRHTAYHLGQLNYLSQLGGFEVQIDE
jgi:uncharacterized damage-inducible protein DinB